MKWAVVSIYHCHDMDHGDPELLGPYATDEERNADLSKRYDDDVEEDTITISLLEIKDNQIVMTGAYIADHFEPEWAGDDDSEGGYGFPVYDDSE